MHHLVPVAIYVPAILVLLVLGVGRTSVLGAAGLFAAGYLMWTLAEYWIHRVVFHFEPEDGWGAKVHFLIHGVHHEHPNDPLRLVMPPLASLPLAIAFALAYRWVFGAEMWMPCHRRVPRRLRHLRRAALPAAPLRADEPDRQASARAAHATPLPGRHAGLRHQRAVLGQGVPDERPHEAPLAPRQTEGVPERPTPEPTRLLAPEAFRLFLVEVLMSTVPFAAVVIALAILLVGGALGFAITAVAVLAVIVAAAVVPRLRMARFRFEVREDEIDLRHGIVIETRTLVPMVRVQHVDTRRTPVSRYFGLAAVAFHTAAGATEIPALREADAAAIRDRIADLALQPEVL